MLNKKMLHEKMLNEKLLQSIRAMIREELASSMGENTDDENNENQDQDDSKKNR